MWEKPTPLKEFIRIFTSVIKGPKEAKHSSSPFKELYFQITRKNDI